MKSTIHSPHVLPVFPGLHPLVRRGLQEQQSGLPKSITENTRLQATMGQHINGSIAASTHKVYGLAIAAYLLWVSTHSVSWDLMDRAKPQGMMVAYYFTHLLADRKDKRLGHDAIDKAHSAINHLYKQANWVGILPADEPTCKIMVQAAKRTLTGTRLSRDPLMPDDLLLILLHFLGPDGSRTCDLKLLMTLTLLLLSVVGLLRFSDLAHIYVDSSLLVFKPRGMLIFLTNSKTDQLWKGQWVAIGATGGIFCPVRMVRRLLREGCYVTSHASHDCGPLLRAVKPPSNASGGNYTLSQFTSPSSDPIKPLGYKSFAKGLKTILSTLNINKDIMTHSGRSGGTTAYLSAGIHNQMVAKLGRWKFANTMESAYWKPFEAEIEKFFSMTRKIWPY